MTAFDEKIRNVILPFLENLKMYLDQTNPGLGWIEAKSWINDFKHAQEYFIQLGDNLPKIFGDFRFKEIKQSPYTVPEEGFITRDDIQAMQRELSLAISYIKKYLTKKDLDEKTSLFKLFISHGPEPSVLCRVEQFIYDLGLIPIVAEKTPSEGREIRPDAEKKIRESSCAIILAEKDPDDPNGKNPRGNVLIESEHAKLVLGNKLIWLKEEGVEWPSLDRAIIWESFTKECLEKAFSKTVRELRAFGLLR